MLSGRSPLSSSKRFVALVAIAALLTGCSSWHGIAGVPIPGGPGTGRDHTTVYVQLPDTLALNINSTVRVADVAVGRVRGIELRDWIATATVDLDPDVQLPADATAAVGQTSLLGTQHLELAPGGTTTDRLLADGDTIPVFRSSAYPSTERVLAAVAALLTGGGIANLETIQHEIDHVLTGRADEIREFLDQLDVFTTELNRQREDITRAIDSTARLLDIVGRRSGTLDRLLDELPPLIDHWADTRELFASGVEALGRVNSAIESSLGAVHGDLHTNLVNLGRPTRELARAGPYLVQASKIMVTFPFPCCEAIPKVVRGDYINASINVDLTLSALDNGLLTATGASGMLRALEQSWGRDPRTMIPDVRFTPNPHSTPGGPLVERGE